MITLTLTCPACPEAYDATDASGTQVGYLRLRHGNFTVVCPDVGGLPVYEAHPKGDGGFDKEERDYYLRFAVAAIEQWIADGKPSSRPKPAAPNVEFTIVGQPEDMFEGWH